MPSGPQGIEGDSPTDGMCNLLEPQSGTWQASLLVKCLGKVPTMDLDLCVSLQSGILGGLRAVDFLTHIALSHLKASWIQLLLHA